MNANLTQDKADALFQMEKRQANDRTYSYPTHGGKCEVPLLSTDGKEKFIFDIYRGRINLVKGTYQNRAKGHIILARLDFGGAPHRNPDGEEIGSPHLHRYRQNYNDKWAYPLPKEFLSSSDPQEMLRNFVAYCHIIGIIGITLPLET